jgi:putative Mg2+ transporter-C (MgtC) family protein
LTHQDVFLRLLAAVAVGAVIGLERELRHKPVGLRTMALVALSSAMFALISLGSADGSHDAVSRVIQGVVTGVGFLGAGSIIRAGSTEESVHGLTTAASIWLAAAGGIACGLGEWLLVAFGCGLGLLVLVLAPVDRIIERRRKTDPPGTAL